MKGIWYLIKVENENDIGTNEIERWKVVDSNTQSVNIGGDYNYQSMNIKCDKGTPAKKETDSAPTGQSLEENQNEETLEHRFENLEKLCVEHFFECKKVQTDIDEFHIKKSFEERIKTIEEWQTQADIEYDANETWKKQMNLLCIRKFSELESITNQLSNGQNPKQTWTTKMNNRIQQVESKNTKQFNMLHTRLQKLESRTCVLSDEFESECDHYDAELESIKTQLSELKQAFEAECEPDHNVTNFHTNAIKKQGWEIDSLKQQLSELQQAFVKYAICKDTEIPEGEKTSPLKEPDIVEQIKSGENRLWELRKSADCVAAIANSASETVSLKEHLIKLMSIHTGLNITGILMCNKTYKIHYNCKEKGIYVELD